jgi:hypothetical protein
MRKKWECAQINIYSTAVSAEEYDLLVDEWAKTVYHHFCQLSSDQNEVPVTQMPLTAESAGA